jgi:O-methyltransferase
MIRKLARFAAESLGYEITRRNTEAIKPLATYAPWQTDRDFMAVYQAIRLHTMVDIYRCYELWMLVEQVRHIPGDIVEVGVWRGGSGALIAKRAQSLGLSAAVYLCDTFRGMVKTDEKYDPLYRGGEISDTSADIVRSLAREMNLSNVSVLEGIFPEDTGHLVTSQAIRLCHIDVDVYRSAQDVLGWAWPKIPVGGIIVYDDYGFPTCAGITRHVDEQRQMADRVVVHNLNGHAIVVRIK